MMSSISRAKALLIGCALAWGCTEPGPQPPLPAITAAGVAVTITGEREAVCSDPSVRDAVKFEASLLPAEAEKKSWFWGVGIVSGDLDGDGRLDLVLPGAWRSTVLIGGLFGFVEAASALPDPYPLSSGGSVADYDGDGDLDLLLTRFLAPDVLLRNDGGVFVDVSEAAGLSADPRRSMVSSWADVDRDGDLDLYIGCYGLIDESGNDPNHDDFAPAEPDFLYLNDGDGTFTDASAMLPASIHDGYALAGGFHDLDGDGWLDLYAVHDFGASFPNQLAWNREGRFVLDDNAHGLDIGITGMGLGVGDLNGDGIDDLVMSAWDGNAVMLSGAEGRGWFESGGIVGLQNDKRRSQKIAWGVDLVDMDNDGDLDAPMAYGFLDSNYPASELQPDALYLQGADGTFVDVGAAWGSNQPWSTRGFLTVDLNDDGFVDLVKREVDAPAVVLTSTCGAGAWLRVRLHQDGGNRFGVGARIEAFADGRRWSGSVRAGGTNHASGGPPEVHLGLGEVDELDELRIRWPDGAVSRLFGVGTRRILDLTRAE
jgi:enediyne biosynthesis protein E4